MATSGVTVIALLASLIAVPTAAQNSSSQSILRFVAPLLGTTNGGHVFPGATLPFGMAKASPDVNVENQGGYSTGDVTGNITGFSHMHDSGTGGVSLQRDHSRKHCSSSKTVDTET